MSPSSVRRVLAASALVLAACAPPSTGPAPSAWMASSTVDAITPADLRHRLEIVAHDSMEGREVGTPGIRRAEAYLVAELQRLGLRPAGDAGTWLDSVDLVRSRMTADLSVRTAAGATTTLGADDVVPLSGLGVGGVPPAFRMSGEAPLLFAGYTVDPGTPAPSRAALEGAAVIVRVGAAPGAEGPPRLSPASLVGTASPAAAVILVGEGASVDELWTYASSIARNGAVSPPPTSADAEGTAPPVFIASPAAVERMIGRPLEGARAVATGLGTFRYALDRRRARIEAFNVVAVLPGSDPALADEYVAIGAHHDHDGIGMPVGGDSIWNGADDDGSGTVAMLEIAERMASLPPGERPARSVLFVWHTAEEKGLLGSEQFTRAPTVPRERIVAQLNIDMIGRNHPDSLFLVGSRRLSTELGDLVEAVNARQPSPLAFDYSWDVPGHPERIYCRSDHYNYARFGIPVTFFTTGLHDDYHQPSDEVDAIDFDKLARVTRLIGEVAMEVAARPARPAVDQPVPPLGAPCT